MIVAAMIISYILWTVLSTPRPSRTTPSEAPPQDPESAWTDHDDEEVERLLRDSAS